MAVTLTVKPCSKCGEAKPLGEFSIRKRSRDGRGAWCKSCHSDYLKGWHLRNKELQNRRGREWHVRTKYGLAREEYEALMASGCEVCGSHRNMHLDHDHGTGVVRGPLCHNCNRAIGYCGDDPERLRALADYLTRHNRNTKG